MPVSKLVHKAVAWRNSRDRGASSVEYGLLLGFVAVVIFGAVATFGGAVRSLYQSGCTAFQISDCGGP